MLIAMWQDITQRANYIYFIQISPISGVGDAVGAKAASPIVVTGLKETNQII